MDGVSAEASGQWSLSNLQQVLPAFITRSSNPAGEASTSGQPSQQLVIDIVNRSAHRNAASSSGSGASRLRSVSFGTGPADEPPEHGVGPFSETIIRHLTQRRVSQQEPIAVGQEVAVTAPPGETAAAAAERHRLTSTPEIDFQAVAKWLEQLLPFLFILGAIFVYHYLSGIFLTIWLLCALVKANEQMRKLVALRHDLVPSEVIAALLYIGTNVLLVFWLTSGQQLYRSFVLLPPTKPIGVWQAVFMVVVADSLVRFCSLVPKLLVVAAVQAGGDASSKAQRRQARLLTLVEYVVAGYRALVPIPVWYTYLLTCTLNSMICSLLAGFYLTFKGYGLLKKGQLLLVATKLVLSTGALYGTYLGKTESTETGCCPICQDPAVNPVRLDCSHVFCEECISEWLERDQTCPMCRSNVKPPGLQSYGDGATSLLPQVF